MEIEVVVSRREGNASQISYSGPQAIPTYLMGVCKLPGSIIDKIASVVVRFFWGQTGLNRKIHWSSWGKMSAPKFCAT